MVKAFTLIETMIALVIASLVLYSFATQFWQLHSLIKLELETQHTLSFLRQIQARALYEQNNYTLFIAQNNTQWCLVAINKTHNMPVCDCLIANQCDHNARIYQPLFDTQIYSKNIYPTAFSDLSGITGNQSEQCLRLSHQNNQQILKIANGVSYVIPTTKRTNCKGVF